jgi:hypothetical protein
MKKKKACEILSEIRTHIFSENFKKNHRTTNQSFVRDCVITFPILILLILNLLRKSLQSELNELPDTLKIPIISKQTFSAARNKLLPSAFTELNLELIKIFYCDNEFKTYKGHRLIGVDGSKFQLPESFSIREKYGGCSNQNEAMTMALSSFAYDLLNGIVLDATINAYSAAERTLAMGHILKIPPSNCAEDLYLFDRGYPSIPLIFFLMEHSKHFIMRCNTAWLSCVSKVLKSGKRDDIVEIDPMMLAKEKREEFQKLLPNVSLKKKVKIRVLVIKLSTGEKEILITSLIDKKRFRHAIFKDLYFLRWGIEENYKSHKVQIEIENFSGKTPFAIEQDFHATVLTGNIRTLLAEEAESERKKIASKEDKYEYKINKNISIGILRNKIIKVLFNPKADLGLFCEETKKLMKKSVIPIRPGRNFKRIRKSNRKYHMNNRRAI